MTILNIEKRIDLFREEIVPVLEKTVGTLRGIANEFHTPGDEEFVRLNAKADAIEKIVIEQSDRLRNVTSAENIFDLIVMIQTSAHSVRADQKGTNLAVNKMLDYLD